MSLAVVFSRALAGMEAPLVTVEVHLANGLPSFTIVGLPETAVREAKDRVRAAIQNAHFDFPNRRITVNLAPADLPKEGGRFDLPMAVGILAASGQIPQDRLPQYELAGELALTGALRPIAGALATTLGAKRVGRKFILPVLSAQEDALVDAANVPSADTLLAVCAHLTGRETLAPASRLDVLPRGQAPDLADVRGQHQGRRALEVAASGGHSLLMRGPPGTGKSMLAERLPGILPPMSEDEALTSAALHSLTASGFRPGCWRRRPFRTPHHTASAVALVGGGSQPRPGEISLATHGVLFLDELPEFDRKVLEVLREPLESGRITISRAARQVDFPASFQLVAAMNPCPCGYLGHYSGRCSCTSDQVARYQRKISGPFLDRIDLVIEMPAVPALELTQSCATEASATVAARVMQAREIQLSRQGKANALLSPAELDLSADVDDEALSLLGNIVSQFDLSARGYFRILKVARTLADLEAKNRIGLAHISEAVRYRRGTPQ